MTGLLEFRERLRNFYGRYEIYVTAGVKFVLGLVTFLLINSQLGYQEQLNQPAVALLLALACAFMPVNIMVAAACGLILIHLSALSLEVCAIGLCLILLLFFLYGKFAPQHGYTAILTPVLCLLKVPQVVPVSAGLLCGPSAYLSVVSGALVFFYIDGVKTNMANFTSAEETEAIAKCTAALKMLTGNKELYLVIAAFLHVPDGVCHTEAVNKFCVADRADCGKPDADGNSSGRLCHAGDASEGYVGFNWYGGFHGDLPDFGILPI